MLEDFFKKIKNMFRQKSKEPNQQKRSWGPVAAVLIAVFVFFSSQIAVALILHEYVTLRHWSATTANSWLTNSAIALFIETFICCVISVCIFKAPKNSVIVHWSKR